jgi:hypothetical protein
VSYVKFTPNEITIWLESSNIHGSLFFGCGGVENYGHVITYCAKDNITDFKIIDEWINKIKPGAMLHVVHVIFQ